MHHDDDWRPQLRCYQSLPHMGGAMGPGELSEPSLGDGAISAIAPQERLKISATSVRISKEFFLMGQVYPPIGQKLIGGNSEY